MITEMIKRNQKIDLAFLERKSVIQTVEATNSSNKLDMHASK